MKVFGIALFYCILMLARTSAAPVQKQPVRLIVSGCHATTEKAPTFFLASSTGAYDETSIFRFERAIGGAAIYSALLPPDVYGISISWDKCTLPGRPLVFSVIAGHSRMIVAKLTQTASVAAISQLSYRGAAITLPFPAALRLYGSHVNGIAPVVDDGVQYFDGLMPGTYYLKISIDPFTYWCGRIDVAETNYRTAELRYSMSTLLEKLQSHIPPANCLDAPAG